MPENWAGPALVRHIIPSGKAMAVLALGLMMAASGGRAPDAGDRGEPPVRAARRARAVEATATGTPRPGSSENPGYFGEFVFTRIRYGSSGGRGFFRGGARWSHDYPRADRNLSRLLHELTTMPASLDGTNVYVLHDPELFKYPVAYISEPGFWTMSDAEATSLRNYVLKGGFLIFDDFENEQWYNLEEQLRRVLPEYHPIEIDASRPIFHSFFEMKTIYFPIRS